jgi:hypothetical protein
MQATRSKSWVAGIVSGSVSTTITHEENRTREITLPAAKSGTLSTRTDDNTGVLTVASGHGITDADTVDVYWAGGVRYGMDVTATTSTTISVNLGDGDNLPSQSTAITVATQVVESFAIEDQSAVQFFAVHLDIGASGKASVDFWYDGDPVTQLDAVQDSNGRDTQANVFDVANGDTNPFGSTQVDQVRASNGTTTAGTLKIVVLLN